MLYKILIILCFTCISMQNGFAQDPPLTAKPHDNPADQVISKANRFILATYDWTDAFNNIQDVFSQAELNILRNHMPEIEKMLQAALKYPESVWAAKFAQNFHVQTVMPQLRTRLFDPKAVYGWEGPDYSKLISYLDDAQFKDAPVYIEAMEAIAGKPIYQIVTPNATELAAINNLAANYASEFYFWAIWIKIKLQINTQAAPNISSTTNKLLPQIVLPAMVLVPAGTFNMGTTQADWDKLVANDFFISQTLEETPQHLVTHNKSFAISQYEISFAEFDACVDAGGCSYRPDDAGWGRGKHPVINVSWNDANQYVRWLSQQTGDKYRLPTEAEWEYAARAGTTGNYSVSEPLSFTKANYGASTYDTDSNGKPQYMTNTMPIDSFSPNPWGLYNVHGNVWEWTADCVTQNYAQAPNQGNIPVSTGNCQNRILRGGSWFSKSEDVRSASRYSLASEQRMIDVGFRIVKELD